MKKLYVVTISAEVVVVADDEKSALHAAAKDDLDISLEPTNAEEMVALPYDWREDAIPYGYRDPEDEDRTIAKWVEMGAAPKHVAHKERLARIHKKV